MNRLLTSGLALFVLVALAAGALAAPPPGDREKRRDSQPRMLGERDWAYWWGDVAYAGGAVTLASRRPSTPDETYSALVTSRQTWNDLDLSFGTATIEYLRLGSPPNAWEVGWVMFRFRDLENYYYFIVKPNGYELGKKHGSDDQIFLATGEAPTLTLGRRHAVRLVVAGPRIRAWVDGAPVLDFTDPNPLPGGAVGLYEEDARVTFDSVTVGAPR